MGAPRKYPDELRERATRMALEALADPDRSHGAIVRVAEQLGVHREALRAWVRKAQAEGQDASSVSADRDARLAQLEKEMFGTPFGKRGSDDRVAVGRASDSGICPSDRWA
ncbi:transposase, partial [Dietzia maris]